jgi:hypothetical protein
LSTEHNQSGGSTAGYETRDANPSSLVRFGIGLALLLVVVWAAMWWLMGYFRVTQPTGPPATPFGQLEEKQLPPMPRLQVNPVLDLNAQREQQSNALKSYGWVDRDRGIVHIPIDRAIDLILERGALPARANPPASAAARPREQALSSKAKTGRKGRSTP